MNASAAITAAAAAAGATETLAEEVERLRAMLEAAGSGGLRNPGSRERPGGVVHLEKLAALDADALADSDGGEGGCAGEEAEVRSDRATRGRSLYRGLTAEQAAPPPRGARGPPREGPRPPGPVERARIAAANARRAVQEEAASWASPSAAPPGSRGVGDGGRIAGAALRGAGARPRASARPGDPRTWRSRRIANSRPNSRRCARSSSARRRAANNSA